MGQLVRELTSIYLIADSNGNHETTSSGHLNMYPLPERRAPGGGELPRLHQASGGVEGTQLEWVKSDLEKVDRSVASRIVVIRHNQYYNTGRAHQCQRSSTIFEMNEDDVKKCWNGAYYWRTVYSEPQRCQMAKWEEAF
ncbi:hypothetical protein F442_20298 [Phytophthora nicotianae P10297]|uniref:Uncharacterized protein n=1 Tax=Phytophthora nicotianae P10297 TaxID=1317064 RepID=W2Y9A0_PHYNI|nr:hypothetical protein F442_20298 [Phytophthora nicotianae P10297]